MLIWYIFFHFGMLYQEKSGNPGQGMKSKHKILRMNVDTLLPLHFKRPRSQSDQVRF
jgi:hypothetical protein